MRAYLIVTDHPYAAVTDDTGLFHFDQVPPGQYTLQLWHERLGELTQPVSVGEKQDVSLTVEYSTQE